MEYKNISYYKQSELKKILDTYYFVSVFSQEKNYPERIDITLEKNNAINNEEIHILSKISAVSTWIVFVVDVHTHHDMHSSMLSRNRYIVFQPIIDANVIKQLSEKCSCDECILGYNTIALDLVTYVPNFDCLKNNVKNTNVIFKTLDKVYDIYESCDNVLFRGSKILESSSNALCNVGYHEPFICTSSNELDEILEKSWMLFDGDMVWDQNIISNNQNHFNINEINVVPVNTNNNLKKGYFHNYYKYPLIEQFLFRHYILRNKQGNEIWYLLCFACRPTDKELIMINERIKNYCQCKICTAHKLNFFKYFFDNSKCLKKNNTLWDPDLHKKTLIVLSSLDKTI